MRTSRKQKIGIAILLMGLALLAGSTQRGSAETSAKDLAIIYGGDCFYCGQGQICNDVACFQLAAPDPNAGKYTKATGSKDAGGNWIAEAVCRTKPNNGKKTCTEDTSTTCITQLVCDNDTCTMNCSSNTASVNNNCTMSGSCGS